MGESNAEELFKSRVREFYRAGMNLVEVWDDPDAGFNADERFPLPERLRPPLSFDEWLVELLAHYTEEDKVAAYERDIHERLDRGEDIEGLPFEPWNHDTEEEKSDG